jgi:hypothetical protein
MLYSNNLKEDNLLINKNTIIAMTRKEIVKQYIEFLSIGNIEKIVGLFAENGKVYSPIYGENTADKFYETLNDDTFNSELNLKGIFEDSDTKKIALYFEYTWTVKSGKVVVFDVVDIIEFDNRNKFLELKIIYDTIVSRRLVEEMKK